MNTIKSGVTTSEFWLVVAEGIIGYFCSVLKINLPPEIIAMIASGTIAYVFSRMGVKIADTMKSHPPVNPSSTNPAKPTSFRGDVTLTPVVETEPTPAF